MSAPCPIHGSDHDLPEAASSDSDTAGPRRRIRNPLTWLLVGLVRIYQLIVSPWFAPTCRYYPSCSAYGLAALRQHGFIKGLVLTAWRLLRCNPWSKGGVDRVPPRRRWPGASCTCAATPGTEPSAVARTLIPRNSDGPTTGDPLRGQPAR